MSSQNISEQSAINTKKKLKKLPTPKTDFDNENRKNLSTGIMWSSLFYFAMGVMMIIISRIWAMLPLNTPGLYQTIGASEHILGIRFLSSSLFFAMGSIVLISGYLYGRDPGNTRIRRFSKIVAILQQPWIGIVFVVIAGVWLYIIFEPDSEFGTSIAQVLYNIDLDVVDEQQAEINLYAFINIIKLYPAPEFLLFGLGIIMLSPMTMYSSAILLHDTGINMNKKRLVLAQPYEKRSRIYITWGLTFAGIFYIIVGLVFYILGVAMKIGLDLFYPLISLESTHFFTNFYAWFPIGFGIATLAVRFLYRFKPNAMVSRSMAWYIAIVQMIIPIYGWFFGISLMMNLYYTGK